MSVKKNILALRQNLYNPVLVDWNQQAKLVNGTYNSVRSTYVINNNVITLTGLDTEGISIRIIGIKYLYNIKAGDKILVYSTIYDKSSNIETIQNYTCSNRAKNISAVSYPIQYNWVGSKLFSILTMVDTVEYGDPIAFYLDAYTTNNATINLKDEYVKCTYNITNLTQMFGEGNEPTLEQCLKIFVADYYPYCESEPMLMGDGALVNFNQMVKNGDFKTTEYWRKGALNYDYSISIQGDYLRVRYGDGVTGNYQVNQATTLSVVKGDKILYIAEVKATNGSNVVVGLPYGYISQWIYDDNWHIIQGIMPVGNNGSQMPRFGHISYQGTGEHYVDIRKYMLINLTKMFGVGNEPTTIEEFKKLYPNEYYEYVESRAEYVDKFIENGVVEG